MNFDNLDHVHWRANGRTSNGAWWGGDDCKFVAAVTTPAMVHLAAPIRQPLSARRSAQIVKLTRPIDRRSLLGRIRPHFQSSLSRWFPNSFGKLVLLFPSSVRKVHDLNKGSPSSLLVVTSVYRATQPRHLAVQLCDVHTNKHTIGAAQSRSRCSQIPTAQPIPQKRKQRGRHLQLQHTTQGSDLR